MIESEESWKYCNRDGGHNRKYGLDYSQVLEMGVNKEFVPECDAHL